jgi:hypothetical protein
MMRRLILWLGLLSVGAIVALFVYTRSVSSLPSRARGQATFLSPGFASYGQKASKELPVPVPSSEEPAWLTEALKDPDPKVRLDAIEAWARNPGASLDPVTHALVDPDESVRTRAQELFEEALARR